MQGNLFIVFWAAFTFISCKSGLQSAFEKPPLKNLSDYGIFQGRMADLIPADELISYSISTPLFSDYSEKQRLIFLPPGLKIAFRDSGVFDFPIGSVIVKTFFYPHDFRDPEKGKRIMETRLLVHRRTGWEGLPYILNPSQTEAILEIAGGRQAVSWIDNQGNNKELEYSVPNKNQCKACHENGGKMKLIGPKALYLNCDFSYKSGRENQLIHWAKTGKLTGFDSETTLSNSPVWNDSTTGNLETRARAYLDINCGHCHNPGGQGGSSGLNLTFGEKNWNHLGVCKMPIAAGQGSGRLKYSILPGVPDSSIIIYRMNSTKLNEMMPEIGRQMIHEEGVALIREWIFTLQGKCE